MPVIEAIEYVFCILKPRDGWTLVKLTNNAGKMKMMFRHPEQGERVAICIGDSVYIRPKSE